MTEQTAQQTAELEVTYNFRTNKETNIKRKSVELKVSVPSAEEIAELLLSTEKTDEKTKNLILDQVYAPIISAIRARVDANEDFNQEAYDAIPADQFYLSTIANLPRSERSTTTKEELEAFADSYVSVMVEAGKISAKGGEQAKALIVGRFKQVAGDMEVLKKMSTRIDEYAELAEAEVFAEHEKAITTLVTKLNEALSVDFSAEIL